MTSGTDTPRVCDRPGCARPASARLVIDVRNCVVTVDAHIEERGGAAVLCEQHAERIVPPRGWEIDDQFNLRPRLFRMDQSHAAVAPPAPAKRSRRRLLGQEEQLLLAPGESYELPQQYAGGAEAVPDEVPDEVTFEPSP